MSTDKAEDPFTPELVDKLFGYMRRDDILPRPDAPFSLILVYRNRDPKEGKITIRWDAEA